MVLRVRVSMPDRPGALGQVARVLGISGADIVQVVVLQRLAGRAVDDFTVVWPPRAQVERLLEGLAAVPGVRVDGIWSVAGTPLIASHDAQLLAQIATNPSDGVATLVDAVPALLAADWAAAVAVPPDWAERDRSGAPVVVRSSLRAGDPPVVPEVSPLGVRSLAGPGQERYAVAPFERAGLVLVAARVHGGHLPPAAFHPSEVDRLAQLVRAAAAVLAERLERMVSAASASA